MNDRIENTILNNLFFNEAFTRKTIPFLKEITLLNVKKEYCSQEIHTFLHTYNNLPTKEAILIELNNRKDLNEEEYKISKRLVIVLNMKT